MTQEKDNTQGIPETDKPSVDAEAVRNAQLEKFRSTGGVLALAREERSQWRNGTSGSLVVPEEGNLHPEPPLSADLLQTPDHEGVGSINLVATDQDSSEVKKDETPVYSGIGITPDQQTKLVAAFDEASKNPPKIY